MGMDQEPGEETGRLRQHVHRTLRQIEQGGDLRLLHVLLLRHQPGNLHQHQRAPHQTILLPHPDLVVVVVHGAEEEEDAPWVGATVVVAGAVAVAGVEDVNNLQ